MERTPQAPHTASEYETEPVRSSNPVGDTNIPEPAYRDNLPRWLCSVMERKFGEIRDNNTETLV